MTTDWSRLWQRHVLLDGKEIPVADYHRQQRLEALSEDARTVLLWLAKRQQKTVSLVQMSKCLMPFRLRTSAVIRNLMAELVNVGFAQAATGKVYYSGRLRLEAWKIL